MYFIKTRKWEICLGLTGLARGGRWEVELKTRFRDTVVSSWRALNISITVLVFFYEQGSYSRVLIKGVTTLELQFWKITLAKGEWEIGRKDKRQGDLRMAVGIVFPSLFLILPCSSSWRALGPSPPPWTHRLPTGPSLPWDSSLLPPPGPGSPCYSSLVGPGPEDLTYVLT